MTTRTASTTRRGGGFLGRLLGGSGMAAKAPAKSEDDGDERKLTKESYLTNTTVATSGGVSEMSLKDSVMQSSASSRPALCSEDSSTLSPHTHADSVSRVDSDDHDDRLAAESGISSSLWSLDISPWRPECFVPCEGPKNFALKSGGAVVAMDCLEGGGRFAVAVKRAPNLRAAALSSAVAAAKEGSGAGKAAEARLLRPWIEVSVLKLLNESNFPYACTLHGVFHGEGEIYVITDLASEGDLLAWSAANLATARGGPSAREPLVVPVARQLFSAVAWLHDLGLCHRDLCLEHVLLDRAPPTEAGDRGAMHVRLAGLGCASADVKIIGGETACSNCSSHQRYRAPEIHAPDFACDGCLADSFAIGVILYYLVVQEYPWESTSLSVCYIFKTLFRQGWRAFWQRRLIYDGAMDTLADRLSVDFRQLAEGLMSIPPCDRLGLGELCLETSSSRRKSVWDMAWLNSWEQ